MPKDLNKKNNFNKEEDINLEGEDIVIESEEESNNSFGDTSTKKLREKLAKAISEKQEYLAGWQRAKADLVNARKDFGEQKTALSKYAQADLIVQIIPVLDSFEMALVNIDESDEKLKNWVVGVKHIYNQFLSILENNGVSQLNPIDENFDHNKHISVESVKVDEEKYKNIILEVLQKGYELNGQIIREAKVKVGE